MIDYFELSRENKLKYGTDIGRIGRMLLANRYSDRSHFIYELLQNAEDALKRRPSDWKQRTIRFDLTETELTFSHFGDPFSEKDVRAVCGIDESTKDITAIGRFGIGFKSVNAYTDRPRVHCSTAHFAIEQYVHPVEIASIDLEDAETRIILPFRKDDINSFQEIADALKQLGARTLLFLRQIDTIEWSALDEGEGIYFRNPRITLDEGAARITVAGEDKITSGYQQEDWIVFSEPVEDDNGVRVGHAELAFLVEADSATDSPIKVMPASRAGLVVYFPTIVETRVGFLIQGPYRTTPSRDNVVRQDPWNSELVQTTARLLVSALTGLRGLGLLDTEALRTLPIVPRNFGDENMFSELFDATRSAFKKKRLLPSNDGGHILAKQAKLARGQELRELINSEQLTALFGVEPGAHWLDESITLDRTPELRNYLMGRVGIEEVTPEVALRRMDTQFLEQQTDDWIENLYAFLSRQQAIWSRGWFARLPVLRLEDGSHVCVKDRDGNPCAFLPADSRTDFPTVREAVCKNAEARKFIRLLGVSEPHLVDDVIANVLPGYATNLRPSQDQYLSDVGRILAAFETDSSKRRKRLEKALSETPFVAAFDAGSEITAFVRPGEVYIASQRLKEMFEGVDGVLLVSDTPPLSTEQGRNLLVASGAARYLAPVACATTFSDEELAEMRKNAGHPQNTGSSEVTDHTLRGLDGLLELLPRLAPATARGKSLLLWEALCDLEERSGPSVFKGTYEWYYYQKRSCSFDAAFVEKLRDHKWVVGKDGRQRSPEETIFEELEWKDNRVLRETLRFKPLHLDQLAEDAGFEPQVLSLLKRYGLTTEAQLQALLDKHARRRVTDISGRSDKNLVEETDDGNNSSSEPTDKSAATGRPRTPGERSSELARPKPITYVQVEVDDKSEDGVKAHQARLELEEKGIQLILADEPLLKRTPTNTPGFDLVEKDAADRELRWVEVKAINGAFEDRWVGLTREQFETAMNRGEDYWLYVVEHASSPDLAKIFRIQDPAGQARTFVYDHGWQALASNAP